MSVFGKSILATPPKIGGVRLKPFSAFHALALLEIESPYITGDEQPSYGETIAALMVCGSTRKDGLRRALGYSRLRWWVYLLFANHTKIGNELSEHISASIEPPRTWAEVNGGGSGKSTGASWPFYIVSVIAQNFGGMDYDSIWDRPLAELVCHKVIIAECNGDVEIAENELENIEKRKNKGE